jgi:hypothetical protein
MAPAQHGSHEIYIRIAQSEKGPDGWQFYQVWPHPTHLNISTGLIHFSKTNLHPVRCRAVSTELTSYNPSWNKMVASAMPWGYMDVNFMEIWYTLCSVRELHKGAVWAWMLKDIIDLGIRYRGMVRATLCLVLLWAHAPVLTGMEPQRWTGHGGKRKAYFWPCRE